MPFARSPEKRYMRGRRRAALRASGRSGCDDVLTLVAVLALLVLGFWVSTYPQGLAVVKGVLLFVASLAALFFGLRGYYKRQWRT